MALGTRRTPERDNPFLSGPCLAKRASGSTQLTGAGSTIVMTMDQLLSGILALDVDDALTLATPTAAAINAGMPGVEVGTSFGLEIINYGDSALTVGLGTGVTTPTISGTVCTVTPVASLASKRYLFVCTGVANPYNPGTTDSWSVYSWPAIAATVA